MTDDGSLPRVQALLEAGDLAGAAALLERALAQQPDAVGLLRQKGQLLVCRRQPVEAARVLEKACAAAPDRSDLWIELGRARNNEGRLSAAGRAFRRAIELEPGNADAHAYLGHALRGLGRLEDAARAFTASLARDPGHLRALKGLGSVHLANGQPAEAVAILREAAGRDPRDPLTFGHLGAALHRDGDPEGAEAVYREALALDPHYGEAWLNLGITLQDTGRMPAAIEAYRQATTLQPGSLVAHNRLADALLAAGQAGEALASTSLCLQLDPGNAGALAARALAMYETGNDREAKALLSYERLVRPVQIEPPPGHVDVAAFNAALRKHVLQHPSLSYEPDGHATRGGHHTRDLLDENQGPVAALAQAVLAAAVDYLKRLRLEPGHPFPGRVPSRPRLAMWAVVMDTAGHQLPHIHPAAWLSGVYYVDLPGSLGGGGDDESGWIEFGLPPEDLVLLRPPPVKTFQPVEGRMFLFPSYFYHRTIPFSGPERRICIAFDVLRTPAG